jgi:hypothetical protein
VDSSFREHGSGTSKAPKGFLAGRTILANLLNWLASLIGLTEEEREEAGIYLDRLGGE